MYRSADYVGDVMDDYLEYVHEEEPKSANLTEGDEVDMLDPRGLEYMNFKTSRKYRMVNRPQAQTYYCDICRKTLKYPSKIEEHMRKHNGHRPFECEVCGSRFSQGHVLKAHMRQHLGEKPFKCSYCDKSFPSAGQKNSHEKSHCRGENRNEPMELTNSKSTLELLQDEEGEQFEQSSAEDDIGEQLYQCCYEDCGMQSIQREEVEEHIQNVHCVWYADEDFETDVAYTEESQGLDDPREDVIYDDYPYHGQASQTESEIVNETKENQSIYSSSLVASTSSATEMKLDPLEEPMRSTSRMIGDNHNMYEMVMVEEGSFDEVDAVRVLVDPLPSKRNGIATQQMQMLVDPSVVELIKTKLPPKNERRKRVKPAKNLDWIIDAVAKGHDVDLSSPHNRRKPKVHVCEYCGKVDKYPSKIEAHRRTHTGVKPYKCDICGMRFTQRTPMRLHVRRHLGHKPYLCCEPDCDEGFVSGALLNQHMAKKHWNQKKYVCMRGCGRCFASSFNQRQHEKKCYFNRDEAIEQEYYEEYEDKEEHGLEDLEREIDGGLFVVDGLMEEIVGHEEDVPSDMLEEFVAPEDIKTENPLYSQSLFM